MRWGLVAVVLAGVLAGATLWLVRSPAAPAPRAKAVEASRDFTPGEIARASDYRGFRYRVGLASMAWSLVVLAVLAFSGPGHRFIAWAGRGRWFFSVPILALLVAGIAGIASLPFDMALGHFHEQAWGLSTQDLWGWLGDWGKGLGLNAVFSVVVFIGIFSAWRLAPRTWPAWVGVGGAVLVFAATLLEPVVIEPVFNRFRPLADQAARERILEVARHSGVEVEQVLVADASRRTTKQNAYVSGFGGTRRVVVYDTLLTRSSPEEVDLVLAHEFAHVKHQDLLRGVAWGAIGMVGLALLLGLVLSWPRFLARAGTSGPGDPRLLPALALVIAAASIVALPITNGISRQVEAAADWRSLEVTQDPVTFVATERSLALSNLGDLRPNGFVRWLLFTHPTTGERIGAALLWAGEHDVELPPAAGP
ncbi:MAG: M48 family metallopeptidase [Actinomycetota bacterium]